MPMKFKMTNRQSISATIVVFYLIPLLFFVFYSIGLMSKNKSWGILSIGLITIAIGSLTLIFLLNYWEESVKEYYSKNLIKSPLLVDQTVPKEKKVTSLDVNLMYEPETIDPKLETIAVNNGFKELNLLDASLKESLEQQEALKKSLEMKIEECSNLQIVNESLKEQVQKTLQDFSDYKLFSEEQLKQKNLQLQSLQSISDDQRHEMEKRQDLIQHLDSKVRDLSYEIKTLLYLHEEEIFPVKTTSSFITGKNESISLPVSEQETKGMFSTSTVESEHKKNPLLITEIFGDEEITTPLAASNYLKKCLSNAEKLTGATHSGSKSSRYREFSSTYYAIDQRRLFDSLRNETKSLIIICKPKDSKPIFVNPHIKKLLGWSPEKFLSDFSSIMQEGMNEWNKTLSQLSPTVESQTRFLVKTNQGTEILLSCHLGLVPTGLFRHYTIGILYPT